MSLDVYLESPTPIIKQSTGLFIRENGKNRELTLDEVKEHYPNADIELQDHETNYYYSDNITHNVRVIAKQAGLYEALWHPEQINIKTANELIKPLTEGLNYLLSNKDNLEKLNPTVGWGSYDQLCDFVYRYLKACHAYPAAVVRTCT